MKTILVCLSLTLSFMLAPSPVMAAEKITPAVDPPTLQLEMSHDEIPDWLARWELARVLSYMEKYDDSLEEYERLLQVRPTLWEARAEKATILYWAGEHEASLEELSKIPSPELTEQTQILMAELFTAGKNYDDADRLYGMYLENNPEDLKVRLRRAEVLSWAQRYDDSLREYEYIIARRPSDIQVRRKYAFVLIWADRHQDAARELRKTLP